MCGSNPREELFENQYCSNEIEHRMDSLANVRVFVMGTGGWASKILIDLLNSGEEIVGVCCYPESNRSKFEPNLIGTLRKILKSHLVQMGIYRPDSFFYQMPFSFLETPAEIAKSNALPIFDVRDIKTSGFAQTLRSLQPDLVLVAGFPRLIPKNLIQVPKLNMVNVHPSLLPKHRGGTPNRWVIRHGESQTGVTIHKVDENYDSGEIIIQRKIEVLPSENWGELEIRSSDLAVSLVREILKLARTGYIPSLKQDQNAATHEPSYRGRFLWINWSLAAEEIVRTCNAIKPISGGMALFKGSQLCIWEVESLSQDCNDLPGTIYNIDQNGSITVACGSGMVRVFSFLVAGLLLSANTIAKNHRMKVGQNFDVIQN